jgi:hypothetical protein
VSRLWDRLKLKERRGSKPRCHLLTHGAPADVAERLTALVAPFAIVSPSNHWMPRGFDDITEARLPAVAGLLSSEVRNNLRQWWLAAGPAATQTPNWDIASTCTIEGNRGLLLVEAKAHKRELTKETAGKKLNPKKHSDRTRRNHLQIGQAILDASAALSYETGLPWNLSRDHHYQMANRFAWAWKVAQLGVPVILVYLGFLRATEMSDPGSPLPHAEAWQDLVQGHSTPLFPVEVWGRRWTVNGQPLIPLIRSLELPLCQDAAS